jgi:hypothetical protein
VCHSSPSVVNIFSCLQCFDAVLRSCSFQNVRRSAAAASVCLSVHALCKIHTTVSLISFVPPSAVLDAAMSRLVSPRRTRSVLRLLRVASMCVMSVHGCAMRAITSYATISAFACGASMQCLRRVACSQRRKCPPLQRMSVVSRACAVSVPYSQLC